MAENYDKDFDSKTPNLPVTDEVSYIAFNLSLCQTSFNDYSIDLWEHIIQYEAPEAEKPLLLMAYITRSSYTLADQFTSKFETTAENLRILEFEKKLLKIIADLSAEVKVNGSEKMKKYKLKD